MTRTLSGNHAAWLTTIAKEVREAGKPVSLGFLHSVVPTQFATSINDGHVTAAENGLPRKDYRAGQRIWIEEAIAALVKARLIESDGNGNVSWATEQDGTWKVKFGRSSYTVYGRAEAAAARDRHMLGSDVDRPGFLLTGWSEVEVEIAVGVADQITKGKHMLGVHPLAYAIPPMSPAEQEQVRADIAKHGVRIPLTLYPDPSDKTARGKPKLKVLDGRHRLQFASALSKPVRVEVFEGTEQEARDLVWSLNGVRRHLTTAQRALAIEKLYGEQARREAKEAEIEGAKRSSEARASLPDPSRPKSEAGRWESRAVKLAGPSAGVSPRSVRAMAEVVKAPETTAKVERGEIQSVSGARDAAAAELGRPKPPPLWEATVRTEIVRALSDLRNAVKTLDGAVEVGTAGGWVELVDEIDSLSDKLRAGLRKRGVL